MNTITEAVDEYIELRRSLGFKMTDEHSKLRRFAEFMQARDASFITQQLALEWASQPVDVKPVTKANRLSTVRSFARYCHSDDPRTEIPAQGLLPPRRNRPRPYLYSQEQINALLTAARNLPHRYRQGALIPMTYYCLFGLLSVTGMRLGEACGLHVQDVDFDAAVLTVRHAKQDRTRLVAVHRSTCDRLAEYVERRRRHWNGRTVSDYLFVSSKGTRLSRHNVEETFRRLTCQIGIRRPGDSRGPRVHDLRHTFCVRALERWYRQGDDPEAMLPVLATSLGHVRIADTYWYLEFSPGLMAQAMERLERRWEGQS